MATPSGPGLQLLCDSGSLVLCCPITPLLLETVFYLKVIKSFLNPFRVLPGAVFYQPPQPPLRFSAESVFRWLNRLLRAVFELRAEGSCSHLYHPISFPSLTYGTLGKSTRMFLVITVLYGVFLQRMFTSVSDWRDLVQGRCCLPTFCPLGAEGPTTARAALAVPPGRWE